MSTEYEMEWKTKAVNAPESEKHNMPDTDLTVIFTSSLFDSCAVLRSIVQWFMCCYFYIIYHE